MVGVFENLVSVFFGLSFDLFECWIFIYYYGGNLQFVNVQIFVVFSVGNGRFKSFFEYDCCFFWVESQNVQGIFNSFVVYLVSDKMCFLS